MLTLTDKGSSIFYLQEQGYSRKQFSFIKSNFTRVLILICQDEIKQGKEVLLFLKLMIYIVLSPGPHTNPFIIARFQSSRFALIKRNSRRIRGQQ